MSVTDTELAALAALPAADLMRGAMTVLRGRLALVSSFGAESAVLLAMAAEIDRDLPILFLETGQHFARTLDYRRRLTEHLGLRDVRDIRPDAQALRDRDPQGQLWAFDPDACCALRKVEPLDRIVVPFDAWITGRKRAQAATRAAMPLLEREKSGKLKLNPLAGWTPRDIDAEMSRRDLPRHPLTGQGFRSIGCAPCTRATREGEDPRAGRWSGQEKTECGIHVPA